MDPACTVEQAEIRRTLRDLLAKRCRPDRVKAAVRTPAGYDQHLWRLLADRIGLSGLALPAEHGGAGCGPAELALACEETGRALLPSPLLPTSVLAAPLIGELGSVEQRSGLLPGIAAGELTAALALPGAPAIGLGPAPGAGARSDGQRAGGIQARREGGGCWRLYGQADHVLGGHAAGLLVVAAHTGGYVRGRTLLFLVEGDAPGLARTRLATMDETRPQARIELRDAPAALLGEDGDGDGGDVRPALERVGDVAAVVLAAEAVGAADRALSNTIEYVQVREQFGRPVGSFQAVKHRIADLHVRLEAARSAAYYAAWAAGEAAAGAQAGAGEGGDLRVAAPLALAQGLTALRAVAGESIQLHGALSFTWEHDAHLYFKRAAADELLFGPAHLLRARAAERAGLFARTGAAGSGGAARIPAPA